MKTTSFLEQRMRADENVDLASRRACEDIIAGGLPFSRPVSRAMRRPDVAAELRQGRLMLARQDFGRRHQRALSAALDGRCEGKQRDHRLSGADIALQEAQHPLGRCHVAQDVVHGVALPIGEL